MNLIIIILTCYFLNDHLVISIKYNINNVTDVFEYFKEKYNKEYKNVIEENNGLENFVKNLNEVSNLNEASRHKDTFYIINQYADLDPKELSKHYAIQVKPYFKVSNKNDVEYLGREGHREIKTSELYDLDNAGELYNEFMKQYKKKNASTKFDRQVHYYRFVKTLVALNNNHFLGNDSVTLDGNADIVKEPHEYFWQN